MKRAVTYDTTFDPDANTLDLSAIPNFDIRRLFAVIDAKAGSILYAVGTPGQGFTALEDGVMTLQASMANCLPLDQLVILYDDGDVTDAAMGSLSFATSQANSTSSPSQIVAARFGTVGVGRREVTIINLGGGSVYFGRDASVNSSTGVPIKSGDAFTISTQAAIFAVSAASVTLAILETF
jgi:hypothetical protein